LPAHFSIKISIRYGMAVKNNNKNYTLAPSGPTGQLPVAQHHQVPYTAVMIVCGQYL
jgi:hypothetical protein